MSDKPNSGVPFESSDETEQALWQALERVAQPEPSPRLRRKFYGELDKLERQTPLDRWRGWLGLIGARGFVTAASCVIVGLVAGAVLSDSNTVDRSELNELKQQVGDLNRNLILDRLESGSASKRLLGVIEAAPVAEHDAEVARALLTRAVDDRVYSVRAAAIDAIGPQLSAPSVGDELMSLLETAESPLVPLALVDLVLRHGNARQIERLEQLSERGALHPDIAQHVKSAVWRDRA